MSAAQRILVITPTYDEAENLEQVAEALHRALPQAHWLVVDDSSPDGTGELADALAQRTDWVHVLHRPARSGLATAYLEGFSWGLERGYTHLCEMDADLSHDPRYLPAMVGLTQVHALVLGSRYVPGGSTPGWTWDRRLVSRGGNVYARAVLGLPFRDLTGGFKCFRREVIETVDLTAIRSRGYAFQVELTWRAHQAGFSIAELPIAFPDRQRGQSKMSAGIFREAAWRVLELRLRD